MHVVLPPVDVASLRTAKLGESSVKVRERVEKARAIQTARHASGLVVASVNAQLSSRDIDIVATPDDAGAKLLVSAVERLGLSARAYTKVLRVARTIADLDGSDAVRSEHIAEAVAARILDRNEDAFREA
jgi:magnesium chelatase family protein